MRAFSFGIGVAVLLVLAGAHARAERNALTTVALTPPRLDRMPMKPNIGLEYGVSIAGFPALAATATIAADSDHYDIEIKAVTSGMIGAFFPWTIRIESKGNFAGEAMQPVEHAQISTFGGKDRSVILDYDGRGGFLERRVFPEAKEDDRDEVPAAMTRDTLDIISAIFASLRGVGDTGACAGRKPVFDGRRRFDLAFTDVGRTVLRPISAGSFGGEALHCSVKIEPIAGYLQPDRKKKQFFSQTTPIDVYVARVGAFGIEVPVRLESTSRYGRLLLGLRARHDSLAVAQD